MTIFDTIPGSWWPGGDMSEDLAVVLRPAEGNLSGLNQEFPNWIAREPLKEVLLPKSTVVARPVNASSSHNPAAGQTIRFEQSDVLLAIIHGSGPRGWRDPEATRTHLLRGVVGTDMRTLPFKSAVQAYKGTKPFPDILWQFDSADAHRAIGISTLRRPGIRLV